MKKALFFPLRVSLCSLGYFFASSGITQAQVTTDDTVNTQVNQNGNVSEITGGETRGNNLFHSFQDFSVQTGNEAFFDNANDISNIFSRVTGGNISNIDGLIRANDSASLFLINPAGIVFGNNASLDIGGSFYGSSASSILFENGEFSAADLDNPPLLTINAPIGLGFRDEPGDIRSNQAELEVVSEIALIGGDLDFDGSKITAANIQLGGLVQEGTVDFSLDNGFSFPNTVTKADVSLINQSFLNISGTTEGSISVDANNVINDNGSNVQVDVKNDINITASNNILFDNGSSIIAQVTSENSDDSGKVNLFAERNITFDNKSLILTQVLKDVIGNAGDIEVIADSLDLRNESLWLADTSGNGNGGDITIDVANQMTINEGSLILSGVQPEGVGDAGDINIKTGSLISNNSLILADSDNLGNSGDINISASEQLTIRDESRIGSQLESDAVGNAGNIEIDVNNEFSIEDGSIVISAAESRAVGNAGNIEINTGSQIITDSIIIADSQAQGSAGDINITARENIILQSTSGGGASRIVTGLDRGVNAETGVIESTGEGNAGNINLSANQIILDDGGFVISDIEGIATGGGEININTNILRLKNNSFVSTFTLTESKAGSINVVSDTLSLESGGKLITSTDGNGNAGTIDLSIEDRIIVDNEEPPSIPRTQFEDPVLDELQNRTGLFVNATERATGNGGDIIIQSRSVLPTNSLQILNGAEVSADGGFKGNAGNIFILAKSVELSNDVSLIATTSSKDGGNINFTVAENIILDNNSLISAEANNIGNGGNINIDTEFIIAFPNGNNDILVSAEQGQGGNININAESLFGIQERTPSDLTNDINASSLVSGLDGTISISTPDINPVQGATELPTNIVEPEETSQQACRANRETGAKNGLNITGKGGIVPDPASPLSPLNVTANGETNPISAIPAPIETSQGKIQPARGIKVNESGDITLTAYRTNNAGDRLPEIKPNCGGV